MLFLLFFMKLSKEYVGHKVKKLRCKQKYIGSRFHDIGHTKEWKR